MTRLGYLSFVSIVSMLIVSWLELRLLLEQDACAGLYRCGVVVISGYTANELIIERRIDNYIVNI